MSYSFTVIAATRADAREKIKTKLAQVVASQPIHNADRDQAQAAADALIDILPDDASRDLVVSINGLIMSDGTQPHTVALAVHATRQKRKATTTG